MHFERLIWSPLSIKSIVHPKIKSKYYIYQHDECIVSWWHHVLTMLLNFLLLFIHCINARLEQFSYHSQCNSRVQTALWGNIPTLFVSKLSFSQHVDSRLNMRTNMLHQSSLMSTLDVHKKPHAADYDLWITRSHDALKFAFLDVKLLTIIR